MAAEVADGRILNVGPSPDRADDHTPTAAEERGHLRPVDPPERVDLRAPWYTVGEQGKTGSCVGWALADSVMWRQLVRKGKLTEEDRLSPRFMWMAAKEMRAKLSEARRETDWQPTTFLEQGMTDVKAALDVARTYGAALEEDLPFHGSLYPGGIEHFYASAVRRRITHYYRLDPEEESATQWFQHWRRWIDQHGPVLIAVGVDANFVETDGTQALDVFDAASLSEYHAIALVGYAGGGFLVRCSWGEDWGKAGYAVATEAYLEQATLESYGIVV
jgi:Papain family cysteine protease